MKVITHGTGGMALRTVALARVVMAEPHESPYHVTPSAARVLGWWVQAYAGEPIPRFLVASLLGMTGVRQGRVAVDRYY